MPCHHNEVELLIKTDRAKVTQDPFDVRLLARLVQHPQSGVEPAQPTGMTGLPGAMQKITGSAPDVQH